MGGWHNDTGYGERGYDPENLHDVTARARRAEEEKDRFRDQVYELRSELRTANETIDRLRAQVQQLQRTACSSPQTVCSGKATSRCC